MITNEERSDLYELIIDSYFFSLDKSNGENSFKQNLLNPILNKPYNQSTRNQTKPDIPKK